MFNLMASADARPYLFAVVATALRSTGWPYRPRIGGSYTGKPTPTKGKDYYTLQAEKARRLRPGRDAPPLHEALRDASARAGLPTPLIDPPPTPPERDYDAIAPDGDKITWLSGLDDLPTLTGAELDPLDRAPEDLPDPTPDWEVLAPAPTDSNLQVYLAGLRVTACRLINNGKEIEFEVEAGPGQQLKHRYSQVSDVNDYTLILNHKDLLTVRYRGEHIGWHRFGAMI